MRKWDRYGLESAEFQSRQSKDPSTRVGAVILRPDGTVASTGWNGFARGVEDLPERLLDRDTKLALTLHAEENALLNAKEPLDGCTIYVWPLPPCAKCASAIKQAGLARVVALGDRVPDRWRANMQLACEVLGEGNNPVEIDLFFTPGTDPQQLDLFTCDIPRLGLI